MEFVFVIVACVALFVLVFVGVVGFIIVKLITAIFAGAKSLKTPKNVVLNRCGNQRCKAGNVSTAKFCARCGAMLPSASPAALRRVNAA